MYYWEKKLKMALVQGRVYSPGEESRVYVGTPDPVKSESHRTWCEAVSTRYSSPLSLSKKYTHEKYVHPIIYLTNRILIATTFTISGYTVEGENISLLVHSPTWMLATIYLYYMYALLNAKTKEKVKINLKKATHTFHNSILNAYFQN